MDQPAAIAPPLVNRRRGEVERDGPDDAHEWQHEEEVVEHQERHSVGERATREHPERAEIDRARAGQLHEPHSDPEGE